MRIRKKINGLRVFGGDQQAFWVDVPDGPAQAAGSRLELWQGQWYLNLPDGTPWATQVLGKYTGNTRDATMQARILGTPGITQLTAYSSSFDPTTRRWSVNAAADTAYGAVVIAGTI